MDVHQTTISVTVRDSTGKLVTYSSHTDGLLSLDIRTLAVSSDGSGTVYAGTPGGSSEKWTRMEAIARREPVW